MHPKQARINGVPILDYMASRMVYSGNILDEQKDIKDWQSYYFTPIKELLEKQ